MKPKLLTNNGCIRRGYTGKRKEWHFLCACGVSTTADEKILTCRRCGREAHIEFEALKGGAK